MSESLFRESVCACRVSYKTERIPWGYSPHNPPGRCKAHSSHRYTVFHYWKPRFLWARLELFPCSSV